MRKPFLLIAGDNYYPEIGTNDWQGCYETYEQAEQSIITKKIEYPQGYHTSGKNKGKPKEPVVRIRYLIMGKPDLLFDWFRIVNLDEWIGE